MPDFARHLPSLATLVAFEAAYRHGSFTRAAEELALSQASISRRVRELERHLELPLFERRRYDVRPTAEGEDFVATVREALGDLARAAARLQARGTGGEGLTIFSDLGLANALVAPLLGEFQRRYPNVKLRVLSSYEPIESLREHFDIGLQYGGWGTEKFDIEPLADDAVFPVCAPQLAARLPQPVTPIEIAKQPLLHLADVGRNWPDWRSFLAGFRLKEPEPVPGLVFDSYQVCLEVAEKGEGIALGWARTVKAHLESGRLVRIERMALPLADVIQVHRPKQRKPNPAAEGFLQLLRERIEPVD